MVLLRVGRGRLERRKPRHQQRSAGHPPRLDPAPHLPSPRVTCARPTAVRVARAWPRLGVSPMPAHHL